MIPAYLIEAAVRLPRVRAPASCTVVPMAALPPHTRLASFPIPSEPLKKVFKFIRFAQLARATLSFEASNPEHPPIWLPFHIALILARAISEDIPTARAYWEAFKHTIWALSARDVAPASDTELLEFNKHALPFGTCK